MIKTSIDEKGVEEFREMYLASGEEAPPVRPTNCTLGEFGCHFLAEVEGRIVGRVILDTLYPPYAELINLLVHPNYRRRGVGSRLVQACIDLAQERRCFIIHLFVEHENHVARRLYSKFGFVPVIYADPKVERGEFMHYLRFSTETWVGSFLREHPLTKQDISPERENFYGHSLYKCQWMDIGSGDHTTIFINAQRGQPFNGPMPRIAGVSYVQGKYAIDGLIVERAKTIKLGAQAPFELFIRNIGETCTFTIDFISREGIAVEGPRRIHLTRLGKGEKATFARKLILTPSFHVPIWTYHTVLTTCRVDIKELGRELVVSAGFEREQQMNNDRF